jgi:hypothetical protein
MNTGSTGWNWTNLNHVFVFVYLSYFSGRRPDEAAPVVFLPEGSGDQFMEVLGFASPSCCLLLLLAAVEKQGRKKNPDLVR